MHIQMIDMVHVRIAGLGIKYSLILYDFSLGGILSSVFANIHRYDLHLGHLLGIWQDSAHLCDICAQRKYHHNACAHANRSDTYVLPLNSATNCFPSITTNQKQLFKILAIKNVDAREQDTRAEMSSGWRRLQRGPCRRIG